MELLTAIPREQSDVRKPHISSGVLRVFGKEVERRSRAQFRCFEKKNTAMDDAGVSSPCIRVINRMEIHFRWGRRIKKMPDLADCKVARHCSGLSNSSNVRQLWKTNSRTISCYGIEFMPLH